MLKNGDLYIELDAGTLFVLAALFCAAPLVPLLVRMVRTWIGAAAETPKPVMGDAPRVRGAGSYLFEAYSVVLVCVVIGWVYLSGLRRPYHPPALQETPHSIPAGEHAEVPTRAGDATAKDAEEAAARNQSREEFERNLAEMRRRQAERLNGALPHNDNAGQ